MTDTQTSALDAAMAQAAAAAATAPTSQALAAAPAGNMAVAPAGGALARPSLDAMADSAGITVDAFVTFKYEGMKVGNGKLFEEFEATLDMSEVAPIVSARATRGGNTTFIKSYDGVSTAQGENFAQKLAHLQATNDKVDGPYNTVELPFVVTKIDTKVSGVEVGTRLGITPPMTGTNEWNAFYKKLRDQGLATGKIAVRVVHKPRTNKNGNEWGVADFELLGAAE